MKVLSAEQIRQADRYTIENEPIPSIDLMERASNAFLNEFLALNPKKKSVHVFCGTGNNGGDGLAISRLLLERGWTVSVYVVGDVNKGSEDFKANLKRLGGYQHVTEQSVFPEANDQSIIIDGLFGTGLARPVSGFYAKLIDHLNTQKAIRIAIDISSGLYPGKPVTEGASIFKADYTISFQTPKLIFFLPDYHQYVGKWKVVDIGLNKNFIDEQNTDFFYTTIDEVKKLVPVRKTFTHKNAVGRLMIIAGSEGKMGAAVLCTKAAFKAGAGLVNVHCPSCGVDILQISIPEAMVSIDQGHTNLESIPHIDDAVAIGPGIGTESKTSDSFAYFIRNHQRPLIIDADGINLLSNNKDLLKDLPKQSILTPHPGEFKRLVGEWKNDFEKLEKLQKLCRKYHINIVLKGAYSAVCNSEGQVHFNSTGNPGLATAGSGDVLTGIVGALLSQVQSPFEALKLGVFVHGLAGDRAIRKLETQWLQASDIINFTGSAIRSILN